MKVWHQKRRASGFKGSVSHEIATTWVELAVVFDRGTELGLENGVVIPSNLKAMKALGYHPNIFAVHIEIRAQRIARAERLHRALSPRERRKALKAVA